MYVLSNVCFHLWLQWEPQKEIRKTTKLKLRQSHLIASHSITQKAIICHFSFWHFSWSSSWRSILLTQPLDLTLSKISYSMKKRSPRLWRLLSFLPDSMAHIAFGVRRIASYVLWHVCQKTRKLCGMCDLKWAVCVCMSLWWKMMNFADNIKMPRFFPILHLLILLLFFLTMPPCN